MILSLLGLVIGLINHHLIFANQQKKYMLLSALFGMAVFSQLNSLSHLIVTQLLFSAALIDLRHFTLPDYLTLTLMLFGLICSFMPLSQQSLSQSVLNLVLAWILLGLPASIYKNITGRDGLGGGDIKLLMAIAVWINWIYLPIIVIIACCSGLLVFILSSDKTSKIAFGPHLAFAGWLAITKSSAIVCITNLIIN